MTRHNKYPPCEQRFSQGGFRVCIAKHYFDRDIPAKLQALERVGD
jgi:hypothetical protein